MRCRFKKSSQTGWLQFAKLLITKLVVKEEGMKRSVICVFLILLLVVPLASAKMVGTVNVPESHTAGSAKLVLNGAGPRVAQFVDVLVYALYLPEKSSDAEKIINDDKPMAVKGWIVEPLINSENLTAGYNDMFMRALGRNKKDLQKQIDTFNTVFNYEPVKVGDLYEYIYIPGKGTMTYKNGKLKDTIPGVEFKKALLTGWLGAGAADSKLKGALLGY